MDDRQLREELLPGLLRLQDGELDANLLAAYVDGTLSDDEHRAVAARVAADPEALMLVRALEQDRRSERLAPWRLAAVAAAVLLAVGLWWSGRDGGGEADAGLPARLTAAAAELERREPDLFGGFRPLAAEALREPGAVTRGGSRWLAPLGLQLEAPGELRWENAPGVTRARVHVEGAGVVWQQDVDGEACAAPALEPGRYVVRLRALDGLAGQELRRVFEVAGDEGRARHERALAAVRANAPRDLAALLAAHYAAQRGLFDAARSFLAEAQAQPGEVGTAAAALARHVASLAR